MRCVLKILLLCCIVFCAGCSNRQLKKRVAETEQNTSTVRSEVQALEQRVQSLEGSMQALSTTVGSLEVKTLRGKKTNYIVAPAVRTGSVAASGKGSVGPTTAAEQMVPAGQAAPLTNARLAAAGGQGPAGSPPVSAQSLSAQALSSQASLQASPSQALPTSAALSLPPAQAPVPAAQGLNAVPPFGAGAATPASSAPVSSVSASSVSASSVPPTTPFPAQGALSLALPPENGAAGQKTAGNSASAGGVVLAPALAPTGGVVSAPPALATPQRPAPLSSPLSPKMKGEEAAYNGALALARGGKSGEAIQRFRAFLQEYPSGRYAPNAYYWIGESLYAQRQYADALLQFKEVSTRYPRHHKTADALLKAGMTYTRMGDKENAALQYRAVVTDFPASEAARYVKGRGLAR